MSAKGYEIPMLRTLPNQTKNRDSIWYGLISLPSVFTIGRIVCGLFAVASTFKGMHFTSEAGGWDRGVLAFDRAAEAIGLGIVCDCLDGFVARLTGRASDFGRQLDSLVDVLTFGLAPALLAFYWGVMPVQSTLSALPARVLGAAGWIVACTFLVCGVGRLARFNLLAEQDCSHTHFVGLAVPGGGAVIAAVIHFAKRPPDDWRREVAWLVLVAILALLMVSRIRYLTLHAFPLALRRIGFLVPLLGLTFLAVWYYSEQILLTMAISYAMSGPLAYIGTLFHRQTLTR